MSTVQTSRVRDLEKNRTVFVWSRITPSGNAELLYNLSQLIQQGVLPKGEDVRVAIHKPTGILALSEYKSQIENDRFHCIEKGQTIRSGKGRIAIPSIFSENGPERIDQKWRSGELKRQIGECSNLSHDTPVVPFAFADTLYQGMPVIYFAPESHYRQIQDYLVDYHKEINPGDSGLKFIYWSERVADDGWEEPHWLALQIEPGEFESRIAELVPISELPQILFG